MTSQEIAAAFGVTVEEVEALGERAILEGLTQEMWNRAVQASAKYAQAVNCLMDASATSTERLSYTIRYFERASK